MGPLPRPRRNRQPNYSSLKKPNDEEMRSPSRGSRMLDFVEEGGESEDAFEGGGSVKVSAIFLTI